MVTAIGFELNIKLSQQMGATGYVTKPFTPNDLLDKSSRSWRLHEIRRAKRR